MTEEELRRRQVQIRAELERGWDAQRLEAKVLLPGVALEGWDGWLCKVCLRVALPKRNPWSWFGCDDCRAVDARVGAVFGSRRFVPLGQHSIMNGLSLNLSDATEASAAVFLDRAAGLVEGWRLLGEWRDQRAAVHAGTIATLLGTDVSVIPLPEWTARLGAGRDVSALDYREMVRQDHPWVIEVEPRVDDLDWLAGAG